MPTYPEKCLYWFIGAPSAFCRCYPVSPFAKKRRRVHPSPWLLSPAERWKNGKGKMKNRKEEMKNLCLKPLDAEYRWGGWMVLFAVLNTCAPILHVVNLSPEAIIASLKLALWPLTTIKPWYFSVSNFNPMPSIQDISPNLYYQTQKVACVSARPCASRL